MEYLRGKLRGKTPSWGRGNEGSRGGSPFWGRRDSGDTKGSLSSLWSSRPSSKGLSGGPVTSSTDWGRGSSLKGMGRSSQSPTPTPTISYPWKKACTSPTPRRSNYTTPTNNYTTNTPSTQHWYRTSSRASPSPPSRPPPPSSTSHPWRMGRASPTPPPCVTRVSSSTSSKVPSTLPPRNELDYRVTPSQQSQNNMGHNVTSANSYSTPSTPQIQDELDYKTLFERERQEKELYGARLVEMEHQQKLLENNLKKFLDLKNELSSFQQEAEESDRVVNDFIKAVVPDFKISSLSQQQQSYHYQQQAPDHQPNLVFRAQLAEADPDLPCSPSPSPNLPLPQVNYTWEDTFTNSPDSNPVGRYAYSTTSRLPSRLDELKLNLVFDVNSHQLPTKLQLEIRDKKGRIVFRKRQNLYYVKVQERLSTLDAEDDYIMTVTSICGPAQVTEEVPIHNKYYSPDSQREQTTDYTITESITLPGLETINTCRSPSEASLTSGFDERSIDSIFDTPLKSMEAQYDSLCREVTCTPGIPDLEEVVEVQFSRPKIESSSHAYACKAPADKISGPAVHPDQLARVAVEQEPDIMEPARTVNPFLMCKKPIIPEVLYRWQRGFRRGKNGQYRKVPILKIQMKYEESGGLLPSELQISTRDGADSRRVSISQKVATVELVVEEEGEPPSLTVDSLDRVGKRDPSTPSFILDPLSVGVSGELGVWHTLQPTLKLELGAGYQ